jgi:hypothetical protein
MLSFSSRHSVAIPANNSSIMNQITEWPLILLKSFLCCGGCLLSFCLHAFTQLGLNFSITPPFRRLGSGIKYQCNCGGCNILSALWWASAGKQVDEKNASYLQNKACSLYWFIATEPKLIIPHLLADNRRYEIPGKNATWRLVLIGSTPRSRTYLHANARILIRSADIIWTHHDSAMTSRWIIELQYGSILFQHNR